MPTSSSSSPQMTAWLQHRYGGPETVTAETVPVPTPAAGEVLLSVAATSLNSGDVRLMRGEPLLVRLFFGLRAPKRPGRGMDVAGTVVAVGAGVDGFTVGDRVVGELPGGGLAEFVVAPADRLVHIPADVTMTDAATLPIAAGTAVQALDAGRVGSGRVLVVGASSGVGTFVVPLAVQRGAEVWALTGERSRSLIERLGATRTFDYRTVSLESSELPPSSFDAVVVIAGAARLRVLRRLVRDGGIVVMVSGDGSRVLGPVGRILRAAVISIGSRRKIHSLAASPKTDVLRTLLDEVAAGRLTPVIERTWPLDEAGAALVHIDAGHTVGKVLVRVE